MGTPREHSRRCKGYRNCCDRFFGIIAHAALFHTTRTPREPIVQKSGCAGDRLCLPSPVIVQNYEAWESENIPSKSYRVAFRGGI
jgi:hypothetical protein